MNNELKEQINERPDGDLVMLCNQIFDWHETSMVNQDSLLSMIFRDSNIKPEEIENIILDISARRLGKVVSLLMGKRPNMFLRDMSNK